MAKTKDIKPYTDIPNVPFDERSAFESQFLNRTSELSVGFGSKVLRVDEQGIWLGAEDFTSAPFKVDMEGNLTGASVTLTGYLQVGEALSDTQTSIGGNGLSEIDPDLGSITAGTITGVVITGGTIQTATSGFRLVMSGANNAYEFRSNDLVLTQLISTSVPYSGLGGARFEHGTGTIGIEVSGQGEGLGSRQIVMADDGGTAYFGFIDDDSGNYYLFGNVGYAGDWFAQSDDTYDLGTSSKRWRDIHTRGYLYLYEGSGSNYIRIQAPSLSSNYTFTLPTDDGSSGQVLQTNGSGTLSWATVSSGANTSLSNLSSTSINADLDPSSTGVRDLGNSSSYWADFHGEDIRLYNGGNIYYDSAVAFDFSTSSAVIWAGSASFDSFNPYSNIGMNLGDSGERWNTVYCDTLDELSDIRVKENIKPLHYGLNEVLALEPIYYEAHGKKRLGFSAQQVHGVLPEITKNAEEGTPVGTASIVRNDMIPVLVQAVKELSAEVDRLKQKNK